MEQIARQLEGVRRTGRWMLIGQRLFQWAAALVAVGIALGVIDYLLRLPNWLRLMIAATVGALAVIWIVSRLRSAAAFHPPLEQLALRLERLYPQTRDALATAVEFADHAERYSTPATSSTLVEATLAEMRERLTGVDVGKLIDPRMTLRFLGLMLLALAVAAGLALALPMHSRIAVKRWVLPFSSVEWPRRTHVASATTQDVWPGDAPMRLSAKVTRGYSEGMRVTVRYRITDAQGRAGAWQSLLLSEQAATGSDGNVFERQIELPETLVRSLEGTAHTASLEYMFEAGDDESELRTMTIVARPGVRSVRATMEPPAYAAPFMPAQTVSLHDTPGQVASVSGLAGSRLRLDIEFTKPVPLNEATLAELAPGLFTGSQDAKPQAEIRRAHPRGERATGVTLTLAVRDSLETPLRLTDEHGLTNLSEKLYRVEALVDAPPTVSLAQPPADESVTPAAVVPVEAVAQDDVAIQRVDVRAQVQRGAERDDAPWTDLAGDEQRAAETRVRHELTLASLGVEPGNTVVLEGVTRDVFDLDGRRHEAVRSSPRRLRIVDEVAMIGQLRDELATVRQQATRLEQSQRDAMQAPFERAQAQQDDLTRRVEGQERLVNTLRERAARNRIEEPSILELIRRSGELLRSAREGSNEAARALDAAADASPQQREQALAEARPEQERAATALRELVSLLDQGQDTLTLQLQIKQLQTQQSSLAEETRRLFPQTVGQDVQSLPQPVREALQNAQNKQAALADQARALVQQLTDAANALQRQGDDESQASAQTLAEAAAIAQRQGLEQSMRQSSQQIGENQLSQAGLDQAQSMETLNQMLTSMGQQQERRMAMLRRRLQQLEEAIRQLLARQKSQVQALDAARADEDLPRVEPGQSAVRRSTMATEEQARQAEEAAAVAEDLGRAVDAQGNAVLALRQASRLPAKEAQNAAVAALEQALQRLQELRRQQEEQQARQEREELKAAYEALAKRQDELRERTRPMVGVTPNRKQRSELVEAGHAQAELQADAAELQTQVERTLLFRTMHQKLDEAAARVVRKLRSGVADTEAADDQTRIAATLRAMAAALDADERQEPFAGSGGGGGEGGGGGQQPQAVPPMAELKLLRGLQQEVYDQTKALAADAPAVDMSDAARQQRLLELSTRQRELAGLGEQLIERMRPAGPQGGGQ